MTQIEQAVQAQAHANASWEAKVAPFLRSCNIEPRMQRPLVSREQYTSLLSNRPLLSNAEFGEPSSFHSPNESDSFSKESVFTDEYKELKRHWAMSIEEGDKFHWMDFFKNGSIPQSNSAIIVDRYLFAERSERYPCRGAVNVANILDAIIPFNCSQFDVLIVLDGSTLLPDHNDQKNKERKIKSIEQVITIYDKEQSVKDYVKDTLNSVLRDIRTNLRTISDNTIKFEFLCLFDSGKKVKGEDETEQESRKAIFRLIHDRRIISNLFTVSATHGWDAIGYEKESKQYIRSNFNQTILFNALLAGVGNEDQEQIIGSIPVDSVEKYLRVFSNRLNGTRTNHYCGFSAESSNDVESLAIDKIHNRILTDLGGIKLVPHLPEDKNTLNLQPKDTPLSSYPNKNNTKRHPKMRPKRPQL